MSSCLSLSPCACTGGAPGPATTIARNAGIGMSHLMRVFIESCPIAGREDFMQRFHKFMESWHGNAKDDPHSREMHVIRPLRFTGLRPREAVPSPSRSPAGDGIAHTLLHGPPLRDVLPSPGRPPP